MENWVQKIESYKDYPEGSREKREYDAFKLPEREFALKYYINAQLGSSERRLYDYYTLPLEEYIALYYADPDLTRWNTWFQKFVVPVFLISERPEYLKMLNKIQAPFMPDFDLLDSSYSKMQADNRFDSELQRFFAFIESIGIFKKRKITFESWISDKEWLNEPNSAENTKAAITEILLFTHGAKYLKSILIDVLIKER